MSNAKPTFNTPRSSAAGSDRPQKKFTDYGRDSHGVQRRRKPKKVSENYVLRLHMVDAAAQVLDEIQTFTHPADAMLAHYFKRNAHLGQRDRAWISAIVWHVLRHKRLLAQLAQSGEGSFSRRLAQLALLRMQGMPALEQHSSADERTWLAQVAALPVQAMSPAIQASLPDWLYAALEAAYKPEHMAQLLPALLQPAGLVLRANTLKADRDAVMAKLAYKQIPASVHPLTPWAIALQGHPALAKLEAYNNGWVEVQDAGSQVLAMLTDAKRGQMVADFCAGAGGKTLAIGAMMRNTGRLYAFDVNDTRLKRMQPRLARSGLSNIAPIVIDSEADPKIKRLSGKFDAVLIDAPCSGMGTLRRNPDLKWRQHPRDVSELAAKQARILASAARLVKGGGRLVYATCSLLPAENQAVVQAFLAANDAFTLLPAAAECARLGVALPAHALHADGMLQLLPTVDALSTDGFFAAVMIRQAPKAAVSTLAEGAETDSAKGTETQPHTEETGAGAATAAGARAQTQAALDEAAGVALDVLLADINAQADAAVAASLLALATPDAANQARAAVTVAKKRKKSPAVGVSLEADLEPDTEAAEQAGAANTAAPDPTAAKPKVERKKRANP
jgi:16S rRNA (cytosine967-C5)-methyltransferase